MNAADDFAAAKNLLSKPLPAYVSYTLRSHIKFDAIVKDQTSEIVVRTSDGTIVRGKIPASPSVHVGGSGEQSMEPVRHAAFKPACYHPTGARMERYEGRELEAIALHDDCTKDPGDKDFDTLYVDPRTHEPIAAVGNDNSEHVEVRLVQHFTNAHGYTLPSTLYARIHGSGLMMWLDVLVDHRYENFRFSDVAP